MNSKFHKEMFVKVLIEHMDKQNMVDYKNPKYTIFVHINQVYTKIY